LLEPNVELLADVVVSVLCIGGAFDGVNLQEKYTTETECTDGGGVVTPITCADAETDWETESTPGVKSIADIYLQGMCCKVSPTIPEPEGETPEQEELPEDNDDESEEIDSSAPLYTFGSSLMVTLALIGFACFS